MSSDRPTNGDYDDASLGWGSSNKAEPTSGVKSGGFSEGDELPAKWLNWVLYLVTGWFTWFEERFDDVTNSSSMVIRAPDTEGGDMIVRAGSGSASVGGDLTVQGGAGAGTDQNGGDAYLRGGTATGDGYSRAFIDVVDGGQGSDSTTRSVTTYISCTGNDEKINLKKPVDFESWANLAAVSNSSPAEGDFWRNTEAALSYYRGAAAWEIPHATVKNDVNLTLTSPATIATSALVTIPTGTLSATAGERSHLRLVVAGSLATPSGSPTDQTAGLQVSDGTNFYFSLVSFTNPAGGENFHIQIDMVMPTSLTYIAHEQKSDSVSGTTAYSRAAGTLNWTTAPITVSARTVRTGGINAVAQFELLRAEIIG